MPYILYLVTAFLINIFFGAWRVNTNKFSWQWYTAIHLPIPFIILIRISFHISLWIIPVGILAALAGQILGGKIYRSLQKPSS